MNKKSIETSVRDIVQNIIKPTEYELIDVEYVKEGPFKYLRVYIDKSEGVTVDDCADLSRSLSKRLDEIDMIKEQYFLEVSSPGVERPFKTETDFNSNIGEMVEVKLYMPLNGSKVYTGILLEKQESNIIIEVNNENVAINLNDISKINKVIEDF